MSNKYTTIYKRNERYTISRRGCDRNLYVRITNSVNTFGNNYNSRNVIIKFDELLPKYFCNPSDVTFEIMGTLQFSVAILPPFPALDKENQSTGTENKLSIVVHILDEIFGIETKVVENIDLILSYGKLSKGQRPSSVFPVQPWIKFQSGNPVPPTPDITPIAVKGNMPSSELSDFMVPEIAIGVAFILIMSVAVFISLIIQNGG